MIHIEGMMRQSYLYFYKKMPPLVLNPSINILKRLFHEKEVNAFVSEHEHLHRLDFIEKILEHLHISYTLNH